MNYRLIVYFCLFAALTSVAYADVAYSNFGPGMAAASGQGAVVGPKTSIAVRFVPAFTGKLSDAIVVLDVSGTARFDLQKDNAGLPGDVIEEVPLTASTPVGYYIAQSAAHPTITAGTAYWIVISNDGTTGNVNWHTNGTGITAGYAIQANGGPWQLTPSSLMPSLQVDAAPAAPITPSSLPHFAVGGSFVTGFTVVNTSSQTASFSISFYDDSGKAVALPFTGLGTLTILSDALGANATKYYETGTPQAALIAGSGVITANSSITIQALVRRLGGDNSYYEAAVAASIPASEIVVPFDTTTFAGNGALIYTGMAISNLDSTATANVVCTVRDSLGNVLPINIGVPPLPPLGHWANYVFPGLSALRGTFDCASNTKIGSIGIRALGNNAISTLPVIPIR